ncbi:MAG: thioredoxin TrxA [Pseudomonadota bacterium]
MSDNLVNITDDAFESDVLQSDVPVLVDFWAEWCGPCKMIAPILEEAAGEMGDRVRIAKMDIQENPQTPPKYGVRAIPALVLFKNGQVEAQHMGVLSKTQLTQFLEENL